MVNDSLPFQIQIPILIIIVMGGTFPSLSPIWRCPISNQSVFSPLNLLFVIPYQCNFSGTNRQGRTDPARPWYGAIRMSLNLLLINVRCQSPSRVSLCLITFPSTYLPAQLPQLVNISWKMANITPFRCNSSTRLVKWYTYARRV